MAVGITETLLRDAHQSLIATRMTTEEMLPILPLLDEVGYRSLECWGGATFDACLRFLDEDPWERLRTIRRLCPKTDLQMLFRGQNMLGYRHYADDVVEYFIKKAADNGMNIIRMFDALNDIRNLETCIKAGNECGIHVQGAISYTTGDVFTIEYYCDYAKQLENAGATSICIKDMAGLLTPYYTYELVKAIKNTVKIPVQVHAHNTSGLGAMVLLKAIEAGADTVDTALSPMALGTSHAATEAVVAALQGTEWDTGLNLEALDEIAKYVSTLRKKYF
ncbi:MAG: pyruvate carboxylase subunit B, partial [Clostridia bacterium]|nr:pyruvate carboxylase subunit B [Clostridia bacterium]